MDRSYTTSCPHCGKDVTIPYESMLSHTLREVALTGVSKRKELKDPTYMRNLVRKRWDKKKKALEETT